MKRLAKLIGLLLLVAIQTSTAKDGSPIAEYRPCTRSRYPAAA